MVGNKMFWYIVKINIKINLGIEGMQESILSKVKIADYFYELVK